MIDFKDTIGQLFWAANLGLVTKIISLLLSSLLDKFMNEITSNFIGLLVNASLDFFVMRKVFHKEHESSKHFVVRYYLVVFASVLIAQALFMIALGYTKKFHRKWYDKRWNKYVFWIRYVCGALTYGFFGFPLQKWWVFK